MRYRDWFATLTPTREAVEGFISEHPGNWARFDAQLGYVLRDSIQHDGVDGSSTIGHYEPTGQRRQLHFATKPCRINTYGDSFTQCHQVSDGETWQEILAAHLGEPIRNFGVGGYGVYQAYRRLLRTEPTRVGAEYLVFYIWGDDHQRSLMPCRQLFLPGLFQQEWASSLFHATPWAHLALDLDTGDFVECESSHPTPESLERLCDADHLYESFADNLAVQLFALAMGVEDLDPKPLERLGAWLDLDFAPMREADPRSAAREASRRVAHCATLFVLERLLRYAQDAGKQLLVILGYEENAIEAAVEGKPRNDALVLDFLRRRSVRTIDMFERHRADARDFRLTARDYTQRYYMQHFGHYNPIGNHFFAFAIKDDLVDWLNPKSPAYLRRDPE